jgi:LuxR family maltose regulon positive regulatory protein
MQRTSNSLNETFHFKRQRLNQLFMEAVKFPLVTICAGSGYGKTSAVLDFLEDFQATTIWIQLSERDNVGSRFWENCARIIEQINAPFALASTKLGFPDTSDKLKQYQALINNHVEKKQRVIVFDDFHFIKEPSVIRFLEECIIHSMPAGTSIFLISRSSPHINIGCMVSKDCIFNIDENNLRFTENELAQYFRQMNIDIKTEHLREIMQDTKGWAFAINLAARSFQKAPGYEGYVRNAMKTNIFRLMETEIWDYIPEQLQKFLISISLIEHLSIDLITILANGSKDIINEFEKLNAYIRRDNYTNAYLIHPLFLEFLAEKQELLTEKQKKKIYTIAGTWCNRNSFKIDALSYFEKTGDYKSIVSIIYEFPSQIPRDIAKYASAILDKAPQDAFAAVEYIASMHISTYMCQGLWEKSVELAKHYETKFLKLPKKNALRNRSLSSLYYCWGYLRIIMCLTDDVYDFDLYFEKFGKYFSGPADLHRLYNHSIGPWINSAGTSRKGAPQDFINSLTRTMEIMSHYVNGIKTGEDELANGEFKFYQGDLHSAEVFFLRTIEQARENKQFEVVYRALFYILRLSIVQGNYSGVEHSLKEMKEQLKENEYINRYTNYDISQCWYYCILGLPEKVPDWLTHGFSPYSHATFGENFVNQMKASYFYVNRNYPPILSYIHEMKKRESHLFGRTEMLAMEACIHYKMKNKQQALEVLKDAYNTASPNNLLMPFIELGKDMRTLTAFALKSKNVIPKSWLEIVNRKSASYAKRHAHIVTKYRQTNIVTGISISPREYEILKDLSHGLSRSEIAANRELSINTVKMVINNVYMKLGAENLADAIRIAAEMKIV